MRLASISRHAPLSLRLQGYGMGMLTALRSRRLPKSWEAPDIMKTMSYRRSFFGGPAMRAAQAIMRGPSEWDVGQRELFAAFVSAHNMCPF
jgi:hypothetical protein